MKSIMPVILSGVCGALAPSQPRGAQLHGSVVHTLLGAALPP